MLWKDGQKSANFYSLRHVYAIFIHTLFIHNVRMRYGHATHNEKVLLGQLFRAVVYLLYKIFLFLYGCRKRSNKYI